MSIQIGKGPTAASPDLVAALIDCHERIRRFADLALAVATRTDVPDAEVVDVCARVERYFREALPLHVRDEEESIEPRLRGLAVELDSALDAMHAEHARHDQLVARLLESSAALRERPGDPGCRQALRDAAVPFESEMASHLRAEEELVFPALRDRLSEEVRAAILAELRARRTR